MIKITSKLKRIIKTLVLAVCISCRYQVLQQCILQNSRFRTNFIFILSRHSLLVQHLFLFKFFVVLVFTVCAFLLRKLSQLISSSAKKASPLILTFIIFFGFKNINNFNPCENVIRKLPHRSHSYKNLTEFIFYVRYFSFI